MHPPLPDRAIGLVHQARQAHVVVASKGGPHVTPELFGWSDDRLWFAAASTTVKSNVLRRTNRAGIVIVSEGQSLSTTGQVEVFDVRAPLQLLRRAPSAPQVVRGIARYGLRNAPDLVAFVGDTVTGKLGRRLPPIRVLYALTPTSGVLVENDAVVESWGAWSDADTDRMADPPAGGEPAVAALTDTIGVAGPWFAEERQLWVPPAVLDLAHSGADTADGLAHRSCAETNRSRARVRNSRPERPVAEGDTSGRFGTAADQRPPVHSFPMSVVTDDYGAPGPAAKQGVLVRGTGWVTDRAGGLVHVEPETHVAWDGVATASPPRWGATRRPDRRRSSPRGRRSG